MKKETNCRVTATIIEHLKRQGKEDHLQALLSDDSEYASRDLECLRGKDFDSRLRTLTDASEWIPYADSNELFSRMRKIFRDHEGFDDEEIAFKIASRWIEYGTYGDIEEFGRLLGTPRFVLEQAPALLSMLTKSAMPKVSAEETSARLDVPHRSEAVDLSRDACDFGRGLIASVPRLWGMDYANVKEEKCCLRVDEKGVIDGYFYTVDAARNVWQFKDRVHGAKKAAQMIKCLDPDNHVMEGVVEGEFLKIDEEGRVWEFKARESDLEFARQFEPTLALGDFVPFVEIPGDLDSKAGTFTRRQDKEPEKGKEIGQLDLEQGGFSWGSDAHQRARRVGVLEKDGTFEVEKGGKKIECGATSCVYLVSWPELTLRHRLWSVLKSWRSWWRIGSFLAEMQNMISNLIKDNRLIEKEDTKRRDNELDVLRRTTESLLKSTLDLPNVLQAIVDSLVDELGYKIAVLARFDKTSGGLRIETTAGVFPRLLGSGERLVRIAPDQDMALKNQIILLKKQGNLGAEAALDGKISVEITDDLHNLLEPVLDQQTCRLLQWLGRIRRVAAVPLRLGEEPQGRMDKLVGCLLVATDRRVITREDEATLKAFANQVATAIQNASLYGRVDQRLDQRVKELEELQVVDRVISSTLELDTVLTRMLEGALKLTGSENGNIYLVDEERGELVSKVSHGVTAHKDVHVPGIPTWVKQTGISALVPDVTASDDPWAKMYKSPFAGMKSELAVPILREGKVIGVINIESPHENAFDEDSQRLLETLAGQATIAIQNAEQYESLQNAQERRARAETIAAMADMSGAMAHQMNNVLGAARARILRLMKRKEGKITDPYVEEQLQLILKNLEGALGRLDTLRRPFRKEESQDIDIDSCVLEALKQVSIPEGIKVVDDLSGDLPMLRAPRERITEVFRNLIKNAVEAMGEQGQLHLRSQLRGKWLEVSVGDTGPGISEDKQKKLFDLEYTAKTTTKEGSYGYGLWWTRTFLDRFGGHIHLESQLGVGSTFTVRLPMVMELARE